MKRGTICVLLAGMLVGALPVPAAAGGFQLNEHGARAMAQAGAFAARANDPSAIFFNPAGIARLRGTQVMAGGTLILPSYTFYGPENLNSNQKWEMEKLTFFPPNGYVTHTWTDGMLKGLAIGAGVVTPYGLGTKWADDWVGKSITREVDLKTFYIMPTVAYSINDFVSVGVGANIVISSVKLRRAVTNFNPEMSLELSGDGKTAYSWNAGIQVRPVENVMVGLTYRSETRLDIDGTATFNPPASLAAFFPGGAVSTSIRLPATYFAGVSWAPFDNFEIEADYQGINWSSYDKLDFDFAVDASNNPNVKQTDVSSLKNYKNAYILRIGAEYALPVLGLKVRAGYFFDSNPVPDEHLEPLLPDANRNGLNLGLGMDLGSHITVDVAWLNLLFNDRTTTKTSEPGGVYFDGTYTGNAQLFGLDITYRL